MPKNHLIASAWKDKKVVNYLATNCDASENVAVQRKQKDGTVKKFLVHRGTDVQQIYVWGRPCRRTPNVI